MRILKDADVKVVRTAYQAPNMNAIAERWVQSVKRECLDRMIFFGERRALGEYVANYRSERPHQGLGNNLIDGPPPQGSGRVIPHQRLGGLLTSYRRSVA